MDSSDSVKNDVVPAILSPAELYIPNHILNTKEAQKAIESFKSKNPNGRIYTNIGKELIRIYE